MFHTSASASTSTSTSAPLPTMASGHRCGTGPGTQAVHRHSAGEILLLSGTGKVCAVGMRVFVGILVSCPLCEGHVKVALLLLLKGGLEPHLVAAAAQPLAPKVPRAHIDGPDVNGVGIVVN